MQGSKTVIVAIVAVIAIGAVVALELSGERCTLIYDANDGSGVIETVEYAKGSVAVIDSGLIPEREDYTFVGWSEKRYTFSRDDCITSVIMDRDKTVYGCWVPSGSVIIVADTGIDDATGIYLLLTNGLFDDITIVSVAGNTYADNVLRNNKNVVDHLGMADEVTLVSTTDVDQYCNPVPIIHGYDGLADLFTHTAEVDDVPYHEWIGTVEHTDWLISFSPMTVTADILSKVTYNKFVFMAGVISELPNYCDDEFNKFADSEAFAYCCNFDHRAVVLDTGVELMNLGHRVALKDPVMDMLYGVFLYNCTIAGDDIIATWDAVAAMYVLCPHMFFCEELEDNDGNAINCLFLEQDFIDRINEYNYVFL